MQFIHYKDFPPVNLTKVGTIGKENQQVTKETAVFALGFYEFERKVAYWVFKSQEERDLVYTWIITQFSKDLTPNTTKSSRPTFVKG